MNFMPFDVAEPGTGGGFEGPKHGGRLIRDGFSVI
jgi:hypothetical protein